jgi:hypothetical protein
MIHYQVRCSQDHEFDGWFKDSAAFDRQSKRGLVECPVCGDTRVERALMAPALARKRSTSVAVTPPTPVPDAAPGPQPVAPSPPAVAGGRMPAHLRAMLQHLRSEVERNCDYVGPQFAEEARKIHHGESEPRGIYGEATPEESEALADEGIEVGKIPWVPLADG